MLVSFTPHGKGSQNPRRDAKKAVGYLMSEHDHTGTERAVAPVLMSGNPTDWCQIVGEGNHAGRYTSGSLNFEENQLSDEILNEVMEDFERALLPGLDPDQYSILWVKHEDKGRTELHFIVAGEELRTGNRLNAYYHQADMPRIDAWKNAINAEYGFSDPNDPEKKRAYSLSKRLPENRKERIAKINDAMAEKYAMGLVTNRRDVLEELKRENLKVVKEYKNMISIADPKGGKNIRLKGVIYEEGFKSHDYARNGSATVYERTERAREERAKEARSIYEELHGKRRIDNEKRYQKNPTNQNTHSINNNGFDLGNVSGRGRDALHARHGIGSKTSDPLRPDFMRKRGGIRRSERVPADEITTTKEKENGKNRRSNDAYFDRIYREKRKRIAESAGRHETLDELLRKNSKRAGEAVERERKLDRVRSAIDTHNKEMTKQKKKSTGLDLS